MIKRVVLVLAMAAIVCMPAVASAYSVGWYEPYPTSLSIDRIEAYITGGTFTGPLTSFTSGNAPGGAALPGWSSFVGNGGAAVVATGPDTVGGAHFYVNFIGDTVAIAFYASQGNRTNVVFSESYNFINGRYGSENAVPPLPGNAPVPIPAAAWLLGSGLIGLVGLRRRFKN
jgi:hypothetical protein